MSLSEVRVLGTVEVVGDDGQAVLLTGKQRQLLAALVVAKGRACGVDELVDALWGETPPASAAKLVQVYVSQLRKTLPASVRLVTRPGAYALEHERVDAHRFEQLVSDSATARGEGNHALTASLAEQALALWRGRAYGTLAYEEFARTEAERLEELRLVAVEERLDAEIALGRHAQALGEIRGLATENPLRERLQEQAMLALYRCGRQSEALEHFGAVRDRLQDELGLEPGPSLRTLQQRILRQDDDLAAAGPPARETMSLPASPNPIVGRASEVAQLCDMLSRRDARLIVLTGAGGSGKTRLALEAARCAAPSFANGAALVELAPLRDPSLVASAIASSLGIRDVPGESRGDSLARALASRELLLVVDNAEHVREAAPLYSELVARAPRLTLLVTSRAVLHVTGERVFPVAPLAEDSAAELFEASARALDPSFACADDNEDDVREICRRLDGLPLAIELAAARIRTITPRMLRERLGARLGFLTGGPRDLSARQQTLRATVEWSYDLLGSEERRAFAALAVFRGGWTIPDAESVCDTDLDTIASLVDDNLVARRGRSTRGQELVVLETLRELAEERLETQPALATAVRRRHAEWIARLAESAHLTAMDAVGPELLEQDAGRVLAVKDDVRASLDWATASDPVLAAEIVASLEQFWVTNAVVEGRMRAEALLGIDGLPTALRAHLFQIHGSTTILGGELPLGERSYQEAISLYRDLGLIGEVVELKVRFAIHASYGDDPDVVRRLVDEVRELNAAAGLPGVEAQCLTALAGASTQEGDTAAALELERQAVATARACGFRLWEQWNSVSVSQHALELGLMHEAEESARAALALARRFDDQRVTVYGLVLLAAIYYQREMYGLAGKLWGAIDADEACRNLVAGDSDLAAIVEPLRSCDAPPFLDAIAGGRHLVLERAAALGLGLDAAVST